MAKAAAREAEVLISPVALFQIIKDIRLGPARREDDSCGSLYGLPCDIENAKSSIEVTYAFPEYSRKFGHQKPTEQSTDQQRQEYVDDVEKFTHEHLKDIQDLNFDTYPVGSYTSRNAGRRLASEDIEHLYQHQKEFPQYFYLVVVLDYSSLSVRAFRISDASLSYLERKNYFEKQYVSSIESEMLFSNLIVELSVSFKLTELEQMILEGMLGSYNLVADVFRLRNLSTMDKEMNQLTDVMDKLSDELGRVSEDKDKLRVNREERERWLSERRALNARRRYQRQPELPESEIDVFVPELQPIGKHPNIWSIYQYNAKSTGLSAEIEEEATKIEALLALGKSDE